MVKSLFRWRAKRAANKKASMSDHGGESKEGAKTPTIKCTFFAPSLERFCILLGFTKSMSPAPATEGRSAIGRRNLCRAKRSCRSPAPATEGQRRQRGKGAVRLAGGTYAEQSGAVRRPPRRQRGKGDRGAKAKKRISPRWEIS